MKTLLLLRHAKSSWKDAAQPDQDRPLNKRGQKTAPKMGAFLTDGGHLPDLILSSPAVRARETTRLIVEAGGFAGGQQVDQRLYPGTVKSCIEVLREIDSGVNSAMLVGHNPGFEDFLEHLTGEFQPLPTCAVARIELPVNDWSAITRKTTGTLAALWRPRDLFPE